MNNNDQQRSPSQLNLKTNWMILAIVVIQLIIILLSFIENFTFGIIITFLSVGIGSLMYRMRMEISEEILYYIETLSQRIKKGEQESLIKMPIGILLYDEDKEIEWANPYMISQISDDDILGRGVTEVISQLPNEEIVTEEDNEFVIEWNDKIFDVLIQKDVRAIYFLDMTKYANIEKKAEETQPVIGFMILDNYDELAGQMDDKEMSRLDSMLTSYFSTFFNERSIYYKRLENDRYLLLMNLKESKMLEEEEFKFIDNIREKTSKRNMPLTISIGLAYGDNTFTELATHAQDNVDLALGRGGDQAIVGEIEDEQRYYGGTSNPMVKRTRVRARVVTQVLENLMKESEQIFIMGHKQPDLDAIGSSLGVRRIAEMNEREAWIVVDSEDLNKDVGMLIDIAEETSDIGKYIIGSEEAKDKITKESLVILVDHHKPSMSIVPELVAISENVVIIDHHRRGNDFPKDPLLVYIEPYASSAGELVTEMFEFVTGEGPPINKLEATGLLGGIIVDTNNFSLRTGSRTFNAASYLQSVGANNMLIQQLLEEDREIYLKRSHLIENMEIYMNRFAIATGEENEVYSSVVTAQTADTMLSFTNIEASFVVTLRPDGKVGVSARSLGQFNVQLVMEDLGGGGHLSNAATQVEGKSVAEVREMLIKTLDKRVK